MYCTKCGGELADMGATVTHDVSKYYKSINTKCKSCGNKAVRIETSEREYDETLYKQCASCMAIQPNANFYQYKPGVNGVTSKCKKCLSYESNKYYWQKKQGKLPENFSTGIMKYVGTCPICGEQYTSNRSHQIYCSDKCKQKAYRARKHHKQQLQIKEQS